MPRDFVLYAAATIVFLLKLNHRSQLLAWWDSAQFALALERYNIVEHRPHPPGYPLYILWGKFCGFFVDNPNLCFVFLGLLLSTFGAVILYKLARDITGRRSVAWLAAAVYTFSPLTIYHELKALTYIISAFFAILTAWYAWQIVTEKDQSPWKIAVSLGLMGMIRPYESILLLPLAIWAVWRLGGRKFIQASVTYIILQIAWLVPVAILSGGFGAYFAELASEGGKHQRNVSLLLDKPLAKTARNWRAMYYYMRQAFPVWAFFALIPVVSGMVQFSKKRRLAVFLALWALPALILYSINYVNYAGICLFISPFLAFIIALGLNKITGYVGNANIRIGKLTISSGDLNRILAVLISLHFLVIFFNLDLIMLENSPRKFDPDGFHHNRILAGDAYVIVLRDGINKLSFENGGADSVLILSDLNYRVLMYYLPSHRIIWTRYLCQKQNVTDGYTMLAEDREDRYVTLPSYEYNGQKYWYYPLTGIEKYAVFTDEMLPNIAEGWIGHLLPMDQESMMDASKAYILDLTDAWGIYFRFGEFGVIDNKTASNLGLTPFSAFKSDDSQNQDSESGN